MASVDAVQTPEFKSRPRTPWGQRVSPTVVGKNLARIVGQQIFPGGVEEPEREMASVLQIGRMSVPEDAEAEWNTWYNGEYIHGYGTVPGVIYARRFRVVEGEVGYTTVYEFAHDKVSESSAWQYQREHSSPRSGRMRDAITMASGSPGVYRRIYPYIGMIESPSFPSPSGRGF